MRSFVFGAIVAVAFADYKHDEYGYAAHEPVHHDNYSHEYTRYGDYAHEGNHHYSDQEYVSHEPRHHYEHEHVTYEPAHHYEHERTYYEEPVHHSAIAAHLYANANYETTNHEATVNHKERHYESKANQWACYGKRIG